MEHDLNILMIFFCIKNTNIPVLLMTAFVQETDEGEEWYKLWRCRDLFPKEQQCCGGQCVKPKRPVSS